MQSNRVLFSASMAVVLLVVQAAAIQLSPSEAAVRVVLPATLCLVPVALWPHRARLGVWVILVGLFANFAPVLANGGLMPIERSTVIEAVGVERAAEYRTGAWIEGSKDVLVADGGGRLTALGDSIVIRFGDGGLAASPGDVVVFAGLLVLAAEFSVTWQRRRQPASERARVGSRADGSATTVT